MVDKVELKKWWDTFVGDGNFTEVRILGKFSYSGYFRSFDNLVSQLEPYTNMDDEQIYFVLNKIAEDCYARPQCEKFIKSVKVSTNDNDIILRRFVMIDCDPIRKSSVNSNEFEFNCAMQKARDIFRFLRENGFQDAIVCHSGNGAHLQLAVDLPNDDETTEILKRFYKYLGQRFTDEHVDIDQKVFNLARLCKVYSTVAKKGANIPDRPWRQSKILYVPKDLKTTPLERFKAIADLLPKEEPKQAKQSNSGWNRYGEKFNLENWLNSHGVEYRKKQEGNSTKYEIKECPWKDQHSSNNPYSSALFQDVDGKITYTCAHSHCNDKQWRDFRLFYEPDAYSKPIYQPQIQTRQYTPQKPKYEIKEEIPELGEKWLSLSSIKKVDLSQIKKVKTGFNELDSKICGLYMSEVTVLSGGNGSGKSSWLNSLILNIIQQGEKCALWSGELPPHILKAWMQMVAAGKKNLMPSQYDRGKYYVPNGVGNKIDIWLDGKLFVYNNEYGAKAEQILHDIRILAQKGVKIFILDNLMTLDIDLFYGDKNERQKNLLTQIKGLAKEFDIHIILVAHPRKTLGFLRKFDISGTSDITNLVDNVFIIHRVNEDFMHAITDFYDNSTAYRFRQYGNVISVEKNRQYGVVDFMCGLYYELESRRFKNTIDECVKYGWEDIDKVQYNLDFPKEENNFASENKDNDLPFSMQSQNNDAPF